MIDQKIIDKMVDEVAEFKEFTGEFRNIIYENSEYTKNRGVGLEFEKARILMWDITNYGLKELSEVNWPNKAWRAVAQEWLKAGGDQANKKTPQFCYHNGSTRGVQNQERPLPFERRDWEMDVRYRLAFG